MANPIKNRILSIVLALSIMLSLLPALTPTADAATVASGNCGAGSWNGNMGWNISTESPVSTPGFGYVLTISGTGDMKNYNQTVRPPWFAYNNLVVDSSYIFSSVVVKDGVTSLGNCAFIGCKHFTEITIAASVTTIGDYAFLNCESLKDVYYNGTTTQWNKVAIGENNPDLLTATIHCTDDQILADAVSVLISALPDWKYITLSDAEQIATARTAYEALTTAQKALVENLSVLTAAEERMEFLENHEHDYTSVVTEPTCTEPGYTTYTCGCGDSYVADETPAAGHDWDEGTVTTPPSATKPGVRTFTCQRTGCDKTRTEDIPALGYTNPFTDVSAGSYFYEPVLWAVENGITSGTSATTFSPNQSCTRGQVVSFLYRAAGSPAPQSTDCPFTDVNPDGYYYNAMLWAVENGITAGSSATTFSPNKSCTRAQVVSFLYRAAGSPELQSTDCPFTDVNSGSYYYNAMLWAVENGITAGTSATTFSPDKPCTRAQVVAFLYRYDGVE